MKVDKGRVTTCSGNYVNLLLNVSTAYNKKFEVGNSPITHKQLVIIHQHDQNYVHKYEQEGDYKWDVPTDDQYIRSYTIQASDRIRRF